MNSLARFSGLDLRYCDSTVRPQDDLFGYVNGQWLAGCDIPPDRATDGAFRALFDQAELQVREIICHAETLHAPCGSDHQQIGDLYASFLDEETIAARGVEPLKHELSQLDTVGSHADLAKLLGKLQRVSVKGPLGIYVDTDAKNSARYLLHLCQSGLGLPDESYYRQSQYGKILSIYPEHIATMFSLTYGGSPQQYATTASHIVELETQLAHLHWDVVKRRDADLTYNLYSLGQLKSDVNEFDWDLWLAGLGADSLSIDELIVCQPDYVVSFGKLWGEIPLDQWKEWVQWQVIRARATLLPDDFVQENFRFYGTVLSGTETLRERWKRGVSLVENLLGDLVGKLYVAKYFPPEAKARIDSLVNNLLEAYRISISQLEWMTPATRQRALSKLEKFTTKIGYPSCWRDYSGLVIARDDLYGNYLRGCLINSDREIYKLHGEVNRDEWFMTPQTVNAYYNPGMNEIVFPAAILQPPFFDPDADDAANYGGIGAVIGHEIGHGFDDQGSKYDGDGNLVDWWTDTDREEFKIRTQMLIEQYNSYVPRRLAHYEHARVNGSFTVGENIGDLGGLSIALLAYQLSLGASCAPIIDGLTGVQRVFYGWAQVWREKSRDAEALQRLATDPHSPAEFRCNGVIRNIDAFYDAFDVCESDDLYLEPSQRVHIWN